jgi:hypothetical protein
MQDRYIPLNIKSKHEDEASILGVFAAVKNKKIPNDLRLLNYYKEVPISFSATVASIEKDVVELAINPLQGISMNHQKWTFVKSEAFGHDVLARVLKISRQNDTVLLSDFAYVQILAERRRNVRVKVTDHLDATFQYGKESLKGTVFDISVSGVSIQAPEKPGLDLSARGMLVMMLRGAKLEMPGKVLTIIGDSAGKRYVIEVDASGKTENCISQFIFQLQSEIIRELKDQALDEG